MIKQQTTNDSLYNRYRPQTYETLIGQDHVPQTLRAIVKNKSYNFNRNYLFHSTIGGVGKTTIAKIFAKAINCLDNKDGDPCNVCPNCVAADHNSYPDIISIAGNEFNQVDKVKPLVDIAKQHPRSPSGMKIIVIDEFQRMSPQAMAEFLTLFEFSYNRTIFLLTTTDISKVLQPIRTRCFKFQLAPLNLSQVSENLSAICRNENIPYTDADIMKISEESQGSMREAIQLTSMYFEAYGEIRDLPLSFKYDQFQELVDLSKLGDTATIQSKLLQIPMEDVYGDFSRFLFQRYQRTQCSAPIDSFLKYQPRDMNSMLLYFIQLNEELNGTVSAPISVGSTKTANPAPETVIYTPAIVEKTIDFSRIAAKYSFVREDS